MIETSDLEPEQARQSVNDQNDSVGSGERLKEAAFALALALLVCAVFWKTVFLSQPITKIARIAEWDSVFSASRTGISTLMDPSLIQLMIPYYFTVARLWQSGQLPLWNPYNACGCPLIGDPQATVFSPLHLPLDLFPNMQVYNLILIAEFVICALGTFGLARAVGISRLSSFFAAVTFTFCPYIVYFHDLFGNGNALFPALFFFFARAAQRQTAGRIIACGIAAAVILHCGHPEISAFGIAFASFFLFVLMMSSAFCQSPSTMGARLLSTIKVLFGAGGLALCLAAPMIFPFLEYLKNSDTYKFAVKTATFLPWQALALNLLQPGMDGGSLYLGSLALLTLPLAFLINDGQKRRIVLSFAAVGALSLALTSKIFPLQFVFDYTALSTLLLNYFMPVVLLCLTILAAFGLDRATESSGKPERLNYKYAICIAVAALITVALPLVLRLSHVSLSFANFDTSMQSMAYTSRDWVRGLIATIAATALLLTGRFVPGRLRLAPIALCIVCGFVTEMAITKNSMPTQPRFDYPVVEPLPILQKRGGRALAIGPHVLRPDTNAVYGICDVRTHNPMFPARFVKFIKASGAQLDQFNQYFDWQLSPMINIMSVSSILSLVPIESTEAKLNKQLSSVQFQNLAAWENARLTSGSYRHDAETGAIFATMTWQVTAPDAARFGYYLVLLDEHQNVVWFGDKESLPGAGGDRRAKTESPSSTVQVCAPVPRWLDGQTVYLGVQLFDNEKQGFAKPLADKDSSTSFSPRSAEAKNDAAVFIVARIPQRIGASGSGASTFSLVDEYKTKIRLYDNSAALPQAYIVSQLIAAKDADDALSATTKLASNAAFQAVVEDEEVRSGLALAGFKAGTNTENDQIWTNSAAGEAAAKVAAARPATDQVLIDVDSGKGGLLVLTDTFYPGWVATVDGAEQKVVHANYLFRGVFVPPGKHHVVYKYLPRTFYAGAALALLCSAGILIWGSLNATRKRKVSLDQ